MTAEEKEMMEASEKGHKEINAMLQKHIGKMFGSLEAASINYFLETGRINGSFRLNLVRMMSDYAHQSGESAATPPDVEQMAEEVLRRKLNEHSFNYYNRLGAEYLKVLKSAMIEMYQAGQSAVQDATPCDAMGHYGGRPLREGKCPKCGKNWDLSQDATPQEEESQLDYPAAARAIALWLKEFCDENLSYPDMVAECARRASKELSTLRSELSAAQEENKRLRGTVINGLRDIKRAAQVNIDEDDVFNAAETMGDALEKSFILTDALLSAITPPESGEQTK